MFWEDYKHIAHHELHERNKAVIEKLPDPYWPYSRGVMGELEFKKTLDTLKLNSLYDCCIR